MIFKIVLNDLCNLKCNYCILDTTKNTRIQNTRLDEIFTDISSNLFSTAQTKENHSYAIDLFGGEPMMNLEEIRYCIKKNNDLNLNIPINISTNGTIPIPEDIMKNTNIRISFDGLWNQGRNLNFDQLAQVHKNIKLVRQIHCVLDFSNIELLQRRTLLDNHIYFSNFLDGDLNVTYGINKDNVNINRKILSLLEEQLDEVLDYFITNESYLYPLVIPYIGTLISPDSKRHCGILDKTITYKQYDKEPFACERFDYHVTKEEIQDVLKICNDCSIKLYCTKGCIYDRIEHGINILCDIYKIFFNKSKEYLVTLDKTNKNKRLIKSVLFKG